jgi:uncharacterized membrane protein (UPF0136 family)
MENELVVAVGALSALAGGGIGYFAAKKLRSNVAGAVNALKAAVARVKAAKATVDQEQGALLAQVPEIVKGL